MFLEALGGVYESHELQNIEGLHPLLNPYRGRRDNPPKLQYNHYCYGTVQQSRVLLQTVRQSSSKNNDAQIS